MDLYDSFDSVFVVAAVFLESESLKAQ